MAMRGCKLLKISLVIDFDSLITMEKNYLILYEESVSQVRISRA